MLTDVLIDRFPEKAAKGEWTELDRRLMVQAAKILERLLISKPEWQQTGNAMYEDQMRVVTSFAAIHEKLCDELGVDHLANPVYLDDGRMHQKPHSAICIEFLTAEFDPRIGAAAFIAERLSLIELGFRHHLEFIAGRNAVLEAQQTKEQARENQPIPPTVAIRLGPDAASTERDNERFTLHYQDAVREFNTRLRRAGYLLNYHNGYLQLSDDELSTASIHEPFWTLVADPLWASVDEQMKEAIDARDRGDRTATFHAFSALESVIKVISAQRQWTRGTEKGASHFVDNLVSRKNGGFIDEWEAAMLRDMFNGVRNPFAHGPGAAPLASFTYQQTTWAIDTAMAWTKSLITRL